jgi:hypothetical protein
MNSDDLYTMELLHYLFSGYIPPEKLVVVLKYLLEDETRYTYFFTEVELRYYFLEKDKY